METIWLQRSSPDVPWGFRLVGGREFGMALAVQRVTPGSVAAAGLGPGDLVLKVGNVQTKNLEHNDAMDLVKQAGNILQLTIKKDPTSTAPLTPVAVSGNVNSNPFDFGGYKTPTRRGSSASTIMYNNDTSGYSTIPRNFGSQQAPLYGTKIEIQRVNPSPPPPRQPPQRGISFDNENFPDYTVAYKSQGPVHDSPGGPVNIRGSRDNLYGHNNHTDQTQNAQYSTMSLPRGVGMYNNNNSERDPYGGSSGPPAYEPRSYDSPLSPASSGFSNDTAKIPNGFNTGYPYQSNQRRESLQQQQQQEIQRQQQYQQPQQQQQQQPQRQQQYQPPQHQAQQPQQQTRQPQQSQVYYASPVSQQSPNQQSSNPYNKAPHSYNSSPHSYSNATATPSNHQAYSSPMSPQSTVTATPTNHQAFSSPMSPRGTVTASPSNHQAYSSPMSPRDAQPQTYNNGPHVYSNGPQNYSNGPQSYNKSPQVYNNVTATPINPQSVSSPLSPMSPRSGQFNSVPSGYSQTIDRRQAPSPFTPINNGEDFKSGVNDQSNIHGSGSNTYATLPHTRPSPSFGNPVNNNTNGQTSNFNVYNSKPPQPFSTPKPFSQSANNTSTPSFTPVKFNKSPAPFSQNFQSPSPKPFQSPMSPGGNYQPSQSPALHQMRRVSFDHGALNNPEYRPLRSPPPPEPSNMSAYPPAPGYNWSNSQEDTQGDGDFGTPQSARPTFSRQSSRGNDPYSPAAYGPSSVPMSPASYGRSSVPMSPASYGSPNVPMSPPSESSYGYGNGYGSNPHRGYGPASVSASMDNLSLGSPMYNPPQPLAPAPPPAPPPPPMPAAPLPPPAPSIQSWSPTPYRRQEQQFDNNQIDTSKVPDKLLNQMIKSAKGGGPKPFSYGIDMTELKKKMGPPTAPKPRGRRGSSVPPRSLQAEGDDDIPRGPRKPAGYIQSDYFPSRDEGPRGQIDDSPINIAMGSNPKKQSKSFKVLQWMTETDRENMEAEAAAAAAAKPRQRKVREATVHNDDDDEMRFSGLNKKTDIPSKTFGELRRRASVERSMPPTQNGGNTLDVAGGDEGVGDYDQTSIRYKGNHIPSPSFRVLHNWAKNDPDNFSGPAPGSTKGEDEDDGLPDRLITEDMVDKRYKGGNIPSKVFKSLQRAVGDETPDEKPPPSEIITLQLAKPVSEPASEPVSEPVPEPVPEPVSVPTPEVIVIQASDVSDVAPEPEEECATTDF